MKIDKAKKIAQNYFDKLKIQGDFTNNNMIGYINILRERIIYEISNPVE